MIKTNFVAGSNNNTDNLNANWEALSRVCRGLNSPKGLMHNWDGKNVKSSKTWTGGSTSFWD